MQTPPRDRSPVLTFVEPWDDALIEEGIGRELDRGGQVFFVHNRIETIVAIADHVHRLVPRARIAVGHGQMRERDLEEVMRRFVNGEVDVLVSTMIVESGLDVPNANTMFVNRADTMGLAQLYQLRGRVGRSHRRAYCYLLVPDAIDDEAERRLQVLEHHTELGSGYRVALRDMEMRGAGNILGPEQSGFVQAVGFDLYLRMLDEQVHRVQHAAGAPQAGAGRRVVRRAGLPARRIRPLPEAKLDVYRRLTRIRRAQLRSTRSRPRCGTDLALCRRPPRPSLRRPPAARRGPPADRRASWCAATEARITFRADAMPRMKTLSAAFHDVQFQTEVRRTHPLSLRVDTPGGTELLDGLVRALRQSAAV